MITILGTAPLEQYLARVLGSAQTGKPSSWLDALHPEFEALAPKWIYARDHYTGQAADPDRITYYLVRKALGEAEEGYVERVSVADYTPHLGTLVDELAGMLFGSDQDATRTWGRLGQVDDLNSVAGKLMVDATGSGGGWLTLWKLLAIELTAIHRSGVLVSGDDGRRVRVQLVPAETITNWRRVGGVLVEALVREVGDDRASLQSDADAQQDRWLHLTVAGWQRYAKSDKDQPVPLTGPGDSGTWAYETRTGQATIPLIIAQLPLHRHVGYLLARKANAIFNQESARDNLVRFCNFPILNVTGSDKTYGAVVASLKKGARTLQNLPNATPHNWITPSAEPITAANQILERKVTEFYRTGFKSFEDVARERVTATEIKARLAGGVFAFLTLLKAAVEDAENQTLYLVEQTAYPRDRSRWGEARVERSDDFVPVDINETVERLRKRYFGDQATVPVGRAGRIAAALEIARWDGVEVQETEVAADVDRMALQDSLDLFRELPIPSLVRAEVAIRYLIATGYVNPADEVPTADGQKTKLLSVLKVRAEALAKAQESTLLRDGGAFPNPDTGE